MPQLGSNKKDLKKVEDTSDNEIVSAYSEEGQRRRASYEKKMATKTKVSVLLGSLLLAAALIVVIIGALTNWFSV